MIGSRLLAPALAGLFACGVALLPATEARAAPISVNPTWATPSLTVTGCCAIGYFDVAAALAAAGLQLTVASATAIYEFVDNDDPLSRETIVTQYVRTGIGPSGRMEEERNVTSELFDLEESAFAVTGIELTVSGASISFTGGQRGDAASSYYDLGVQFTQRVLDGTGQDPVTGGPIDLFSNLFDRRYGYGGEFGIVTPLDTASIESFATSGLVWFVIGSNPGSFVIADATLLIETAATSIDEPPALFLIVIAFAAAGLVRMRAVPTNSLKSLRPS